MRVHEFFIMAPKSTSEKAAGGAPVGAPEAKEPLPPGGAWLKGPPQAPEPAKEGSAAGAPAARGGMGGGEAADKAAEGLH